MKEYKILEPQIGMIRWILNNKNKNESGIPRKQHVLDILKSVESRQIKKENNQTNTSLINSKEKIKKVIDTKVKVQLNNSKTKIKKEQKQ